MHACIDMRRFVVSRWWMLTQQVASMYVDERLLAFYTCDVRCDFRPWWRCLAANQPQAVLPARPDQPGSLEPGPSSSASPALVMGALSA